MRAYAERKRIDRFLRTLGRRLTYPIRLYLVGGSVVVDLGLRPATPDIDYVAQADEPRALGELERLILALKDELQINAKPASPADHIPVPASALERSRYVRTYGKLSVYYYDLPSTVISKLARGAERDLADVEFLVRSGAVSWSDVEATWREMRQSPRGWLRHAPAEIEQKLQAMRGKLGEPDSARGPL